MATDIPAKLVKSQVDGSVTAVDFDSDTILCLLVVAGGGAPNCSKTGVQYVSDVTAANSEVTGTGYARQTVAGKTVGFNAGSDVVEWSFTAITFAQNAAGFTNARYAVFAKDVGGADSSRVVLAVADLTTDRSVVGGDLVLSAPSGGLINWTPP